MERIIFIGIWALIYIPVFVVSIICMVLAIKLMKRGITALDKYIEENL